MKWLYTVAFGANAFMALACDSGFNAGAALVMAVTYAVSQTG